MHIKDDADKLQINNNVLLTYNNNGLLSYNNNGLLSYNNNVITQFLLYGTNNKL